MSIPGYSMPQLVPRMDRKPAPYEILLRASDSELLSILAEADEMDEVASQRRLQLASQNRSVGDDSPLEVTILGSMGCRLGMLNGEAGGFLLRVAGVCLLVDPGPGAVYFLSQLEKQARFLFSDLDAILCSHAHPDHVTDLLPCIEGMTAGMRLDRGNLVGNRTVIEKFMAFSPYHLGKVQAVCLASDPAREQTTNPENTQDGGDEALRSGMSLGGVNIRATPTFHLEEGGQSNTGIGFLIQSQEANVWYTGDTSLFDGLLQRVKVGLGTRELTFVIANADASDIKHKPGKAQVCHLLTRDVYEIAKEIEPHYILIQHYDAAYSSVHYRLAQAIYLQRLVDRSGLKTVILPSANGLCLSFDAAYLKSPGLYLESDEGPAIQAFVEAMQRL